MAKTTKTKKEKVPTSALQAPVYTAAGVQSGTIDLPESIFGLPWNADLVHLTTTAMQANARGPIAHTKDRGEVQGGGKKPWKQKGTGRARHGSSRSPIWKGGGTTHGPRNEKDYSQKINRQARQKALLVVLSRKAKDGEIIFIDSLEMGEPKATEAKKVLAGLSKAGFALQKKRNAALLALPSAHIPTMKSFGNFGNIVVEEVRNLNPLSVLSTKYLVITDPAAAFEILAKKKVVKTQ